MIKIKVNDTITPSLVDKLISQHGSNDICIVIDNTKKQSASQLELVAKKYPNIIISVIGGLTPNKNKFNNEYYQSRTYYNPMVLSKIVKIFNSIERKMNIFWTDTQKAMFYYQELCNYMEYSECKASGRDVSRNLEGLLYGKAVCSGFAMIFKEALDRLGFPNEYQNVESSHSWNVAYIDGHYRAFELTWDCYNKKSKGCSFLFFNLDKDFYKDKHHNLSYEKEEREYPIVPYTVEELRENYRIINLKKIKKIELDDKTETNVRITDKNYRLKGNGKEAYLLGPDVKTLVRADGTKFALVYVGENKGLNKFIYFSLSDGAEVRATSIYSEQRLDRADSQYDDLIANGLLSGERLRRKVNEFNGYVGYMGRNHSIYYNGDFEQERLNIIR